MLLNPKKFSAFTFLLFLSSNLLALPTLEVQTYDQLVKAIRETRAASEERIERAVDAEKVRQAWEIGSLIQKHILNNDTRAEYGKKVIKKLAKDLDLSKTELSYMLEFSRAYPIVPPAGQLSWSHYQALLAVNDVHEREALALKAEKEHWGRDRVREEVRKRSSPSLVTRHSSLPEVKPGKLHTYRIVKAASGIYKDQLVVDLGFSAYYKPDQDLKLSEGDIVEVTSDKRRVTGKEKQPLVTWHLSLVTAAQDDLWTYKAHVIDIVDGDTLHVSIDLGFGFTMNQTLRLRGLDAPEINSSDGKEAKEFLRNLLGQAQTITVKTSKSDKYDRYLADVFVGAIYINQKLLDEGFAAGVRE